MEPMNSFLNASRQSFKNFIDAICSVSSLNSPSGAALTLLTPSYSTPIQILGRLPPTSREGFPSLPYLIDHAKNFALLVNIWLDGTKGNAHNIQATDGDLLAFHNLCVALHQRTQDCLNKAERAERPSSNLDWQWEELVDRLESIKIANQLDDMNSDTLSISSVATTATRASARTPLAAPRPKAYASNTTTSAPASLPNSHNMGPPTPPEHSPLDTSTPHSLASPRGQWPPSLDGSSNLGSASNVSSDTETTTALPPFNPKGDEMSGETTPGGKSKGDEKNPGWYWGQTMKAYKKRTKEQEKGRGKERER